MAYRWQPKRLLRPSRFALLCAALLPPFVAGCQSNVQQDLVAREMRMQEDQLYAMEDYLAQYQQLICKYRAENEALRRQLTEDDDTDATLPARPSPRVRNGTPPAVNGPAIEVPPTPKTNGTRPRQELEVPPLEETTSSDAELEFESSAVTPAIAFESATQEQLVHDVWLHGEVVENDAGGGPRLMVEVEPLDVTARTMQFSGRLSLMILAPNEDGGRQSLARWDFAAEEVQSAVDTATEDHIIRFYLELPADTPVTDSTEIWARLLPQGGNKLLAHAAINLREPGRFSSLSEPPVRRTRAEDRPAAAAVYEGTPSNPPAVHAQLNDAGWTIARPGEPAKLELAADDSEDQWRPSSEPMPTMIARRAPARRQPRVSRTAPRSQTSRTAAAKTRLPTGWSPDRPADAPASTARMAKTPGRPSWSATR